MQQATLIAQLKRRGFVLSFNETGQTVGCAMPKDDNHAKNERFMAKHMDEIKGITKEVWPETVSINSEGGSI